MGEKILVLRPEMSSKILDESHFKFHVECKAKIINAVNKLRKGKDFLEALSKLKFSTDKRWTANTVQNPNVAVLMEILEEYKKVEHRPTRAKVLGPILEYAIGLFASDLFYTERGEWFIYQMFLRSDRFRFNECFINPNYWYPVGRTCGIDEEKSPPIEQEYQDWYGIDPSKEECVISYDMTKMQELIKSQREWYENEMSKNEEWAKEELKCM